MAQILPPVVYPTLVPAKQSHFDRLANRTGALFLRDLYPIASAQAEHIQASVVRLEELVTHEVVLGVQVYFPEQRETAVVSEEEMSDLKDTVDYILNNAVKLNEKTNPVTVEYVTLSGARFGYTVHRRNANAEEMPATAYVETPTNPYIPQSGSFQRLSPQLLQKIVLEAGKMMEDLNPRKPAK